MKIIDFSDCQIRRKKYGGANGNKISIVYKDDIYMLKFPSTARLNKDMSYANSCISEYLGCHIFNIIGIEAQQTLLGIYRQGDQEKIVVACKDFTSKGIEVNCSHLKRSELLT